MKTSFTSSFQKDLKKLQDDSMRSALRVIITKVESAGHPGEIAGLKKLKGGTSYYRLRLGDYRVGLVIQGDEVRFVRFLHRSDIYRYFP